MQQYASSSVSPRSIAWLVRNDEWERFEEIIKYNSAMLGGYFNVIIPVTDQASVSELYKHYLIKYDPDIVVMPQNLKASDFHGLHPFAYISWESVSEVVTLDPLDPFLENSDVGETVKGLSDNDLELLQYTGAKLAVADKGMPDTSHLALVACGDVEPRGPTWFGHNWPAPQGYREYFLEQIIKASGYSFERELSLARDESIGSFLADLDCYKLSSFDKISDIYKFPLSNAVKILEACLQLQSIEGDPFKSFINLTAIYRSTGTRDPELVILLSDKFGIEEAALFWNLRASEYNVAWLSFSDFENSISAIVSWLCDDYIHIFHSQNEYYIDPLVTLSSSNENFIRLQSLFSQMKQAKKAGQDFSTWKIVEYDSLVAYDYERPSIQQDGIVIMEEKHRYTFVPKLPDKLPDKNHRGMYAITLKGFDLKLPQVGTTGIISSVNGDKRQKGVQSPLALFRVNKNRNLRVQTKSEEMIEFNKPLPSQILQALFAVAGFSRIEKSSVGKYQQEFIRLAGGLDHVANYLVTAGYQSLFQSLSNNINEKAPGIFLKNEQRRALHHLHLYQVLGKALSTDTEAYFKKDCDELPYEVVDLLEKGLLERGFLLKCDTCSCTSWYSIGKVTSVFECSRCNQSQVYKSNPLWFYKLPEVVFQGFHHHMEVPLLALSYMKRNSQYTFDCLLDSDVYEQACGKKHNVDILCISDGRVYCGEAKSNDEIDATQFSFYKTLCKLLALDGIIFATTEKQWNKGTLERIERLKLDFAGEVIVLDHNDLY